MSVEFVDPAEKALEETYHLKCKVLVKDISYRDYQSQGEGAMLTEEMVFLLPQESTQRDLFFNAWLPELEQNPVTKEFESGHSEVACQSGHPIYGYFKCSVHRADERVREPYMFVMSKSSEEELKLLRGKDILVTVLPDSQEGKADYAKDYELTTSRQG